ncbi:hypothetical protein KEM54_001056 [Ascosphaera aggregata]|nr:hypothetical protein KEM54_001056 [Ascosphaera aggregata]
MTVTVESGTPLAQALGEVVQPKLVEVGWSTGGGDDSALAEYVILMLVNGKTQEQIASELSNDLLGLGPDDTEAVDFAKWLFEQVQTLNRKINGEDDALPLVSETPATTGGGEGGGYDEAAQVTQPEKPDENQPTMAAQGQPPHQGEIEVPTGPRSQRNNNHQHQNSRGRIVGQINKAMDRSHDGVLHRVRGTPGSGRVNSHWVSNQRNPRNTPRTGRTLPGRQQNFAMDPSSVNMNMNMTMMPGQNVPTMMPMNPQQQMQMLALLEEQARMMAQVMPGFVPPAINHNFQRNNNQGGQQRGRSLFERTEFQTNQNQQRGNERNKRELQREQQLNMSEMEMETQTSDGNQGSTAMIDVRPSPPDNQDGICKWNLKCRNSDCPYAHQSPAAPEGAPIDASDVCSFGVACKNRKCVGRHPSPAQKASHQAEELCRFFPNCTNPNCRFKHPNVPMCRNGGDCSTPGCKFTHLTIPCKFTPCLNPACPFKHAEGQRGQFQDKVWTPGEKPHVSERRFVDENGEEELIKPANQAGIQATGSMNAHDPTDETRDDKESTT